MKPVSPALLSLLASGQFYAVNLLSFFFIDGTVLRLTDADIDIKYGGNTYLSSSLLFKIGSGTWSVGVDVSQMTVTLYPFDNTLVNGQPFLPQVPAGLFNGAEAQIDIAYMPTYGDTSLGIVTMMYGRVGEITGESELTVPVNSHMELLSRQVPANLYQTTCINTLYDGRCTLNKAALTLAGTVTGTATANSVQLTFLAGNKAAGYFDQGTIKFTSGANAGLMWTVKKWDGASITVARPFRAVPAAGDTVQVAPGCDKSQATCQAKFGNLTNFRGYPYTPVPETAL